MVMVDPDRRTTVAYMMNRMGQGTLGNERTARYAALIYEALSSTLACWQCGFRLAFLVADLSAERRDRRRRAGIAAGQRERAERRLERYRIKQQTKVALAEAPSRSRGAELLQRREIAKVLDSHAETDTRWLDYEMDVAKLLDFPLMTDMRDPLTERLPPGEERADFFRPASVDDLIGDREATRTTSMPSTTTSPRSTSPKPKRSGDGAPASPTRPSSD